MPDSEIELDREYTVPLSRAWIAPRHRRVVRAVNVLREFAARHMKSEDIKIDSELNERLWERGITRPPRRVTVRMTKDEDGLVTVSLPKKAEPEEIEEQKPPEALPAAKEEVSPPEKKEEVKPAPAAPAEGPKPEEKPTAKAKPTRKKKPTKAKKGEKKSAKKTKTSKK